MQKLKVLDLFSGIGGFSLGLERTGGFDTVAFCEIDPAARRVLKKHWPHVPIYGDVTQLKGSDVGAVDVICGGFPCQDLSTAGKGAGLAGARSGLWFEYHRLIAETRPKWVLIENVSVLRARGLEQVLSGLTEIGYDAEWHCIPAAAVGASHRRDRVWIVAYPASVGRGEERPHSARCAEGAAAEGPERSGPLHGCSPVAHADGGQQEVERNDAGVGRLRELGALLSRVGPWSVEPSMGRVADGIPGRMDRLKQLGNAVVPQIPELLGRAILCAEGS